MPITLTDIDVGLAPGDGLGDPGRTAFQAINVNNAELEAEVLIESEVDARAAVALTAFLATVNAFTKQQYIVEAELTDGANIAWNLDTAQTAFVDLGGNRTLDNPTNMKAGATYILRVIQDSSGSRTLAFGSAYLFPGGTAPTLTTAGGAVDLLSFYCDGSAMLCVPSLDFS